MTEGPLADVLVIDLTRALAGPQAAMMLGDLGARVIKVESADRRRHPRLGAAVGQRRRGRRERARDSTYFMSANRNKESIVLDLKDPTDAARAARAWCARADVLLENFRVGVLDRLGFTESSGCTRSTPAWSSADHRLRPRRTGGAPRRLRPDRAGRGRADDRSPAPSSPPRWACRSPTCWPG